ncbi:MAG: aminomethyl-transferring glycine dehydrogenase subunit GcvPA [Gammaproteobacteria bacterium]|nr:aminomethyl-transferring glycine dehydrogenase subunit GcvPA [Gammaproteobacteria bacterium]
MPFIPHTEADKESMLKSLGAHSIEELFDEIPKELLVSKLPGVSPPESERVVTRLMQERGLENGEPLCFIGAGAYEHHIPAAVWDIVSRGEFMTSYTPYQAEASQGTLQVAYEYQTMISRLTGMEVSNASLYDGATATAEAILMAVRANKSATHKRVLIPKTLHPNYRKVVRTMVHPQGIEMIELPFHPSTGQMDATALSHFKCGEVAAVVIPQPNFFGILEEADTLADHLHAKLAFVIGVVNPLSLALLKAPGEWGGKGADIVVGEGQPLGVPLSSGGPYFGFMCSKREWIRQMPGRIVGRTLDLSGKPGFTLTLQAREQHIRRSRATSNICTNQGLLAAAATLYLSLMGPEGLRQVALASHKNCEALVRELTSLPGIQKGFEGPTFHETVLKFPHSAHKILEALSSRGILGGFDLTRDYPELKDCVLVCATEMREASHIERYKTTLGQILL